MNLTKDYQLPEEIRGMERRDMAKYYSKFSRKKRISIAKNIQAMEIRDSSLISDDLYEAQQAVYCTLLKDLVKGLEKSIQDKK